MAKKAGYTKYHFSRKFQEEMHCTLTEYVQATKLERAKWYLINTHESLEEISLKLGYSSRGYFSDVFRRATGMSPSGYRRENGII